jgi:hypothetical protein
VVKGVFMVSPAGSKGGITPELARRLREAHARPDDGIYKDVGIRAALRDPARVDTAIKLIRLCSTIRNPK